MQTLFASWLFMRTRLRVLRPLTGAGWLTSIVLLVALCPDLRAAAPANGGFESGLNDWKPLWTRAAGAGRRVIDQEQVHSGRQAIRIEHAGERDWSFEPDARLQVQTGDVIEMNAWVRVEGIGSTTLCAATCDASGRTISWTFGDRSTGECRQWTRLATRFVVPHGIVEIQPRLIGSGPATVWLDDFTVEQKGSLAALRRSNLAGTLSLTNEFLAAEFRTDDATFSVLDRRTNERWRQKPFAPDVAVLDARLRSGSLALGLLHLSSGSQFVVQARLEPESPELLIELRGEGELPAAIKFPYPFFSRPGQYLVVPMNEGISFPVDDGSIEPMRLIAYGGHGICMAFWGVTEGMSGQMSILETPDDAAIRVDRVDGCLSVGAEWESQKGRFGYARRLRYVFIDQGGHVAMCKRYRAYARQNGLVKTLARKRQENPNVDRLIGAVNVWCWERDPLSIVKEMQNLGIDRILWSNRQPADGIETMNALGVLTSRYDIYQDLMDPAAFPQLRWTHPDWTTEGWPKDIMVDQSGKWIPGWEVEGKDGKLHPCGVLCDRVAPDYARRRISPDLQKNPYLCRFIDTTTASPWRECYAPEHPLTRSESRRWKMELLRSVSDEFKLVTGCETGHDASVPFVHYFEGMLSLGPYRVPDAGRDMERIWTSVPPHVAQFQLGHRYRLPLWELVFHDCGVSQWYWGDYSNKLPALWDKRDLLNVLYGTPPMFMFTRSFWHANKGRFAQSYKATGPVARAAGYAEMTDHKFLTPNRDVQETRFANGVRVVVNFGDQPFALGNGSELGRMSAWSSVTRE